MQIREKVSHIKITPTDFVDACVRGLFPTVADTLVIKMRTCVLPRFLRKYVNLENRVQDIIKYLNILRKFQLTEKATN